MCQLFKPGKRAKPFCRFFTKCVLKRFKNAFCARETKKIYYICYKLINNGILLTVTVNRLSKLTNIDVNFVKITFKERVQSIQNLF